MIAEKLETIIAIGIANIRMRDFYDIYILLKLQGNNIDKILLSKAVIGTSEKRGSLNVLSDDKKQITYEKLNYLLRLSNLNPSEFNIF